MRTLNVYKRRALVNTWGTTLIVSGNYLRRMKQHSKTLLSGIYGNPVIFVGINSVKLGL